MNLNKWREHLLDDFDPRDYEPDEGDYIGPIGYVVDLKAGTVDAVFPTPDDEEEVEDDD